MNKNMTKEERQKRELFLARYTHKAYTEEERIQMFQEKKYRVPTPYFNKKKYNRKRLPKIEI